MSRRIILGTPLDPVAAATRLKATVTDRIDATTPAGVLGRGSEQRMTLWYYRPRITNSFRSTLTATLTASAGGTRIDGRIGAPTSAIAFMVCWFGFLGIFLLASTPFLWIVRAPGLVMLPMIGVPLAMIVFGILLVWWGRRDGAADEAAILAFLATTIDAHPV